MDRIEKLIKMLDSPKASTRYDACEWLRVAPSLNDAAMAALERASKDPDPEVRDAAQRALNLHQPAPPHPETKTRERPGLFLACEGEEVVQALPQVCLYCGQHATHVKQQVFSHQPAWGCLADLILAWLYWTGTGTRKVTMKVPVCERHFRTPRWMKALGLGAFFAFITPLLVVWVVSGWLGWSLSEFLPGNSGRTVFLIWVGGGVFLFALWAIVERVSTGVRVESIDDTGIWLKGVASEFSSAVTESRKEPWRWMLSFAPCVVQRIPLTQCVAGIAGVT